MSQLCVQVFLILQQGIGMLLESFELLEKRQEHDSQEKEKARDEKKNYLYCYLNAD
jgi:hypothetical protein